MREISIYAFRAFFKVKSFQRINTFVCAMSRKKNSPKNDYTAIRRFFVISSEDFFENVVGSEQFQDT